jgi:hypothetical protein
LSRDACSSRAAAGSCICSISCHAYPPF